METQTQTADSTSATERYRQLVAAQTAQEDTIPVTLPSGMVIKFARPSMFGTFFRIAKLPDSYTAQALGSWTEQGVAPAAENDEGEEPPAKSQWETVSEALDTIISLSRSPRLVNRQNVKGDQLSVYDVSDADWAFLMQWLGSGGTLTQAPPQEGGEAGDRLATFPEGSATDAVAGTDSKPVRAKAKRASRAR